MMYQQAEDNNRNRGKLLKSYGLDAISAEGDDTFQNLLKLAALICDAPIAYISIIDDDNQYILSQEGAEFETMPVEDSFCQHTLKEKEILIIENPKVDDRTKSLPLLKEDSGISFYAGQPLIDRNDNNLGAFCIMDYKSRTLSKEQKEALKVLSNEVIKSFNLRRKLLSSLRETEGNKPKNPYQKLEELENQLIIANQKLVEQQKRIELKREKLRVASSQLKDKTEDFALIIDVLPACISFVDLNYCYQLNNRTYEKWFNLKREDIKGKHVSCVIGADAFQAQKKLFDQVFAGEIIEFETVVKGKSLWVRFVPARDHKGKTTGCFVLAEDLTQFKKYQNQLEQSNEGLKSFAYVASHDIKSPLKTIISFGQLLKKDLENQASNYNQEFLDFIIDSAKRLEGLTTDLLNYAQIQESEEQSIEPCSLTNVLNLVLKDLQQPIQSSNAFIDNRVVDFLLNVHEYDLLQLLQNIISNGIKYQKQGSQPVIKIESKQQQDYCEISVQDNGIGIAEKDLEKIFQPFTRLHANGHYSGTGIGLATCKKIVEKYHFELNVASTLNEGTTFTFGLPLAKKQMIS